MRITTSLTLLFCIVLLSSCIVSKKKYNELLSKKLSSDVQLDECMSLAEQLRNENDSLRTALDSANKVIDRLKQDSAALSSAYFRMKGQYDNEKKQHENLKEDYNKLLNTSTHHKSQLTSLLQQKQDTLDKLLTTNAQLLSDLQLREQKVRELEDKLKSMEKAVNDLKALVQNALMQFKDGELNVEVKNGRVYISMSEKLLFKSGSYTVDARGVEALKKLSGVLKTQKDLQIAVEGHTDNIPMNGGQTCLKDNWDLSVLRATAIVRILLGEGVAPEMLVAQGRGPFAPIDSNSTVEGRARNRRIEIILIPNLDELFKIINSK